MNLDDLNINDLNLDSINLDDINLDSLSLDDAWRDLDLDSDIRNIDEALNKVDDQLIEYEEELRSYEDYLSEDFMDEARQRLEGIKNVEEWVAPCLRSEPTYVCDEVKITGNT